MENNTDYVNVNSLDLMNECYVQKLAPMSSSLGKHVFFPLAESVSLLNWHFVPRTALDDFFVFFYTIETLLSRGIKHTLANSQCCEDQ